MVLDFDEHGLLSAKFPCNFHPVESLLLAHNNSS